MADTKLTNLSSATPALGDLVYIVDVSDTTDDPAGSSRKTTLQSVLDTLGVPYSRGGGSIVVNSGGSVTVTLGSGDYTLIGGRLLFSADNTWDVGVAGDARPRTLYAGGNAASVAVPAARLMNDRFIVWEDNASGLGSCGFVWYDSSNALIFGVGNTSRWKITPSGHFQSLAANAYDVGGAGNEPRSVYASTSMELGGTGWVRNDPGKKRLSANATNATATLSSGVLSDLTVTLVAGRKYTGRVVLVANNSTGAEGLQYDFNGGTATMTNFQATAEEAPIGATLGTTNSTALGTALTNTVVSTSDTVYAVNITLVCNAGGTFIPRFAENSTHVSGTATVKLGSCLWLEDTP